MDLIVNNEYYIGFMKIDWNIILLDMRILNIGPLPSQTRSGLIGLQGLEICPARRAGGADLVFKLRICPPSGKLLPHQLRMGRRAHIWPTVGRAGQIWLRLVC